MIKKLSLVDIGYTQGAPTKQAVLLFKIKLILYRSLKTIYTVPYENIWIPTSKH